MFGLAEWNAWMTVWSNVCWNVEPEPLRVALPPEPPDPPEVVDELGLLLLLHAASTVARPTITMSRRERTWVDLKGVLRSGISGSTGVIVRTVGGSDLTSA